ncbi:MAG: hypothetical protein RLZZ574_152 [Cyanobacteriota bacterium]|jgi:hypothetical protein
MQGCNSKRPVSNSSHRVCAVGKVKREAVIDLSLLLYMADLDCHIVKKILVTKTNTNAHIQKRKLRLLFTGH